MIALGLAFFGTVLGSLLQKEVWQIDGEERYYLYGWPWDWRTDAPASLINNTRNDESLFAYNDNGFAPAVFFATTSMWFIAALIAEGLLFVLGWAVRRLVRRKQGRVEAR